MKKKIFEVNSCCKFQGSESSAAAVASDANGPQDSLEDLSLSHDVIPGRPISIYFKEVDFFDGKLPEIFCWKFF